MPRIDPNERLSPSILNRLIDPATGDTDGQPGYNLRDMMEAVREDLEDLLNTRQVLTELAKKREKVGNSIVGFGLPEVTSMPAITPQDQNKIKAVLAATLLRHEPRLRDVHIVLLNTDLDKKPMLRFQIKARLLVEPSPEVVFNATPKETGHYSVEAVSSDI